MTTHKQPIWQHTLRVYYEDTDAGGVVYYANYLKFAERARSEILRKENMQPSILEKKLGVVFVVKKCSCNYLRPAKLDDLLLVKTQSIACSGARIELAHNILFAETNPEVKYATTVAEIKVTLALLAIDKNENSGVTIGKPKRLSKDMLDLFQPSHAVNQ